MHASRRTTAIALVIASLFAVFEILRTQLTRVLEGRATGVFDLSHRLVPMWILLVVVSPWCAFMARRFPFRRGRTLRTLAAHVAGSAVFVALHMTLMLTYHAIATQVFFIPSGHRLAHLYVFYTGMEMSVYAGIVGVVLLIDARREAAERDVTAARLEGNLSAARLESLQAQIRPHFLFNTLNTLAVLARRGDGPAVDRAIGDLGELLRSSFDAGGRAEIPLGEELAFLERYVNLQRLRFPGRLEVEWRIDDEARRVLVPALIVQPIVENAIEHGLATLRGGRLHVSAGREGEALAIEVADDGPGFAGGNEASHGAPPRESPAAPGAGAERGLGLANTRERLALLYGGRGTLTCHDRPGGGGLVRIRLPWRTAPA
jgi:signal transduction histidine kinase